MLMGWGGVMYKGGDGVAKYEKWISEDGIKRIKGWVRDGLANEQIAKNMGIAESTLYEWQKKYSELSEALKETKEIIDYEVENALYIAALNGNVTAQIFWLKNRRPDKWREKQDIGITGEVKTENPFVGLTTEELKKLIANA